VTRLSASMGCCGQTRKFSYKISPDACVACFSRRESHAFALGVFDRLFLRIDSRRTCPDVMRPMRSSPFTGRHGAGPNPITNSGPRLGGCHGQTVIALLWAFARSAASICQGLVSSRKFWSEREDFDLRTLWSQNQKLVDESFARPPIKKQCIKWVWTPLAANTFQTPRPP